MVEPVDMLIKIRGYNKKGTNIHMDTHGRKVGYIVPFSMRIKRVLPVSPYTFQVFNRGAKESHLEEMSYIVLVKVCTHYTGCCNYMWGREVI